MKYLVGMSGGIDSSVAAVMLKKQGHEVVGAHMILWAEDMHKNKCCNTSDLMFARKVADQYDIPFYTIDFREVFKDRIVQDAYLDVYKKGMTPNPCVSCNRNIRFGALLEKALELGMDKVVTGHYAKVEQEEGVYKLRAGKDESKDQSYFLHRVTQDKLARMHFPLGDMLKSEVKSLGEEWGTVNKKRFKRESQDLCFLPEKTPEPFLKRQLKEDEWRSGEIRSEDGETLGEHRGLPFYTIGQRRGLEIGGLEEPLYVIGKDEPNNAVIVGTRDKGKRRTFSVQNLSLITGSIEDGTTYDLQIRYGGKRHRAQLKRVGKPYSDDSGELWNADIELEEALEGITPGQFAVFYDGAYCLGGGEIV